MFEILNKILSTFLTGTNLLIALIALFAMAAHTAWVFADNKVQRKIRGLILPNICILIYALAVMYMVHLISLHQSVSANSFAKGKIGVLVLQIVGDDDRHSLQRDLVESLDQELLSNKMPTNIVVRAGNDEFDDTRLGVSLAHQKARAIGQTLNAQIVIWGS